MFLSLLFPNLSLSLSASTFAVFSLPSPVLHLLNRSELFILHLTVFSPFQQTVFTFYLSSSFFLLSIPTFTEVKVALLLFFCLSFTLLTVSFDSSHVFSSYQSRILSPFALPYLSFFFAIPDYLNSIQSASLHLRCTSRLVLNILYFVLKSFHRSNDQSSPTFPHLSFSFQYLLTFCSIQIAFFYLLPPTDNTSEVPFTSS